MTVEGEQQTPDNSKVETPATPAEKPAEAPADVAAIRAENERLRAESQAAKQAAEKATQEAQGARQYVENLVQQIQRAAAESPKEDIREKFVENPVGVVDELFQQRMGPIYGNYLSNQSSLNRQLAAQRLESEGWKRYEKEVDEFMAGIPPEVRAQPGSYEQAFRFIQAKHLDEIIEERATQRLSKEKQAFVEGASPSAAAPRAPAELTSEEKAVADGLGIPHDEYRKWRDAGSTASA